MSVFRKKTDIQQQTGTLENVTIRNVKAKASAIAQLTPASGILITGIPGHPVKNLTLENIDIALAGGGTAEHALWKVPEAVDQYPEVKTFGPTIPAYGIWARHVEGLKLMNISFKLDSNELRPAFVCEDGKDILLKDWNIPSTSGAAAIIRLEEVNRAVISRVNARGIASSFVQSDRKSKNIELVKSSLAIPQKQ